MDTKEAPIIPVKQALITLAGYQFLVVQLPDGRIAIIFSYLCRALHIDRWGQIKRIQAHPLLAEYLVTVQITTAKGERIVNALVVWALTGWLSGFQITRLSEEQRTLILALQRETFDTFVRPFFPETRGQPQSAPKEEPAQTVPPKEEPESGALPPPEEEESYWEHMAAGYIGLEQEMRELATLKKQTKADRGQIIELFRQHKKRLDHLEAQVDGLTVQVQRLSVGTPLTAEHQGRLYVLVRAWADKSGQDVSTIERELAAAFGVETLSQLTEAAWNEIAAGFQERLGWSL